VLTLVTLAGPQKKEGYLAEKTLWGFKKRYCVLKDGILFVFTDKVHFIHTTPHDTHDTARHELMDGWGGGARAVPGPPGEDPAVRFGVD
jgi:hypothetical protein